MQAYAVLSAHFLHILHFEATLRTNHASTPTILATTDSAAVDQIDRAIARFLQHNGRASNAEIGKAVGLSASAASRRVKSLEQRKIITGYRALLNDDAFGTSMTVFVRVTLERQSAAALNAFEKSVSRCPSILLCHLMAGEYDYMLQVKVGNMAEYEALHHKELSRFPGVARLESSFAVREVSDVTS